MPGPIQPILGCVIVVIGTPTGDKIHEMLAQLQNLADFDGRIPLCF
jgi:hypothetical protein